MKRPRDRVSYVVTHGRQLSAPFHLYSVMRPVQVTIAVGGGTVSFAAAYDASSRLSSATYASAWY